MSDLDLGKVNPHPQKCVTGREQSEISTGVQNPLLADPPLSSELTCQPHRIQKAAEEVAEAGEQG